MLIFPSQILFSLRNGLVAKNSRRRIITSIEGRVLFDTFFVGFFFFGVIHFLHFMFIIFFWTNALFDIVDFHNFHA